MPSLSHATYGKSQIRLTKVRRQADRHELFDLSVSVRLRGAMDQAYLTGDNSRVVATDTMKNTVYALASDDPLLSIEAFALRLAGHFQSRNPQVDDAMVSILQDRWQRIDTAAGPHPHAFISAGQEKRECNVQVGRVRSVQSSITGLDLLKTGNSAFSGFARDSYTTLKDTDDRILATTVSASWRYLTEEVDYNAAHASVRAALIDTFAAHKSLSVQHTLYAMGEAALAACSDVKSIRIGMPNRHRIPFNLEPLGLENRNEIFINSPEPFGSIYAEVVRD